MHGKSIAFGIIFFVVFSFGICGSAFAFNVWGYGYTKEEACSNAEAKIRSKGCFNVGGKPDMSDCECDTFTPNRSWKCNVDFECKQKHDNYDEYRNGNQTGPYR